MKIGIDLKPFFTGSKYRGIGMYSRELIKALCGQDTTTEYHFLNLYEEYHDDPQMDSRCFLHDYYTGPKIVDVGERQLFRDVKTESILEAQVKHFLEKSEVDVMFFTSPTEYGGMYKKEWFENIYTVGILYDLIPLIFPEQCLFNETTKTDYLNSLEFLKSLDLLCAISQSAKDDAVKLLGIPEEKIIVIHAGIDDDFKKLNKINISKLREKYNFTEAFILFAGGIDFKKNIEVLIKAFSKLDKNLKNRYELLITGKASQDVIDKYKSIAIKYGVGDKVIFTGFIPKEDLIELYNITDLFVFPSLYEGFGLPVIEAMACGARVITSNCSSLIEIAKNHATLIDPKSVKSITNGIKYVLSNPIETLELAEKSIDYAYSYTWERVAKSVYEGICERFNSNSSYNNKQTYLFEVTDGILEDISLLFIKNNIVLTEDVMLKIVANLSMLEFHSDNMIKSNKANIIYDMTVVYDWLKNNYVTGIGRVSYELLNALKKITNVTPVIVSKIDNKIACRQISLENFEISEKFIEINSGSIFFMPELQLRGVQVKNNHPYMNELRDKGVKCFAVIYDILPLRLPEYFENKTSDGFSSYVKEIVENYDGIMCDSRTVADDVIDYCIDNKIMPLKDNIQIGYFHLGQNSIKGYNDQNVSYNVKQFLDSNESVFFMLGTVEPRKGHEIILNTFEKMWNDGSDDKLCIIGHIGWNMSEFINKMKNHKEYAKKLVFFENAPDVDIQYVYENATALIQASAGEGFGLPLIEAGHHGLPILCSDIPIFHEVAGDNVLYFNRYDNEDIIRCVKEFKQLKKQGENPKSENISIYTWDNAANKVYGMLVENKNWYASINREGIINKF